MRLMDTERLLSQKPEVVGKRCLVCSDDDDRNELVLVNRWPCSSWTHSSVFQSFMSNKALLWRGCTWMKRPFMQIEKLFLEARRSCPLSVSLQCGTTCSILYRRHVTGNQRIVEVSKLETACCTVACAMSDNSVDRGPHPVVGEG